MKQGILGLIVILALASMSAGGTFAGFSDSETTYDNYIETGSLDLKVAKYDDNWENRSDFSDDLPWGTGLFPEQTDTEVKIVPCFAGEEDLLFDKSYECNLKLWNAGSVDGRVFVHIKNVTADPETLLSETIVEIWYDQDDDGEIDEDDEDGGELVHGTLEELACQSVPVEPIVWLLPANNADLNLKITIDPPEGAPGNSLTFDIQFELIGIFFIDSEMMNSGFGDTEVCLDNYLKVKEVTPP